MFPQPAPEAFSPAIGLQFRVAEHLVPFFKVEQITIDRARRMAWSALNAYYPEARADYVNAARTIAFSMAALALLGKAVSSNDLSHPEQMRAYGRANALNRSADQSERAMMQRRRYLLDNPQPEPPAIETEPEQSERDPVAEAEIQAQVAEAMQDYVAASRRPAAPQASAPKQKPAAAAPDPRVVIGGVPMFPTDLESMRQGARIMMAGDPRDPSCVAVPFVPDTAAMVSAAVKEALGRPAPARTAAA
jgi:hypothetical protein